MSYLKKVTAMAVSRDTWVANVASRLHGMLGEYAFERYGRLINYDHSWNAEIERLLRPLRKMIDPKITKTKAAFDRKKAFREACRDAIGAPVTSTAKNFFLNTAKKVSDDEFKRVAKIFRENDQEWDEEFLLSELLKEFAPDLALLARD